MGGEGISGLLGHADRRALIGLKSLYYSLITEAMGICIGGFPRKAVLLITRGTAKNHAQTRADCLSPKPRAPA